MSALGQKRTSPLTFLSTAEPHRDAGLEPGLSALRIESQAPCAAIVVTDRALGLPGRE
jgi:hypothetical protein